jgi:hypothetical protein
MKSFKKILAVLAVAVLTVTLLIPFASSAASTAKVNDTHDYFLSKYPALTDKNHVFNTAEYYQFYYYFLGGQDFEDYYTGQSFSHAAINQPATGKYVFLIGGASNPALQAAVPAINEVAKEYGITAIYNFDPKLAGTGMDITTDATFATQYNQILTKLGIASLDVPSIIVYEKTSVTAGTKITEFTWNESDAANATTFKAALRTNAFDPAATAGKITSIEVSDSDYVRNVINARYFNSNKGNATRKELKPLPETAANLYEVVTLDELRDILASDGNYAVLLGGLWCHNTWAVVGTVDKYAKEHGIDKIYFFDTVLDSASSGSNTQTRNSNTAISQFYVNLINDYLPNIYTLNQGQTDDAIANGKTPSTSYSISTPGGTATARRVQLPNFFVYNKNHKDASNNAAPVIGQVEIMTELWFMDSASSTFNQGTGSHSSVPAVYDSYTKGYTVKFSGSTFTYWAPGLNQVLAEFDLQTLNTLIAEAEAIDSADYTTASYAELTAKLNAAKTLKASILSAIAAKSPTTLAPSGSEIKGAYAALNGAVNALVEKGEEGGNGENGGGETTNPPTGDEGVAIFVGFGVLSACLGAFLVTKRKSFFGDSK